MSGKPPLPTQSRRQSPSRACKGKAKAADNTKKKKKAAANSKAGKKAVAAAQQKVVEDQAPKEAPPEPVKVKTEPSRRRVFTEEEDVALCKAWVNCSMDPIVGADQKKDHFWIRIHSKFNIIYAEDSEVAMEDVNQWPIKSIRDRFSKLEKEVKKFNIYYRQVSKDHDKSGWTTEMKIDAAKNLFADELGRPFKHHLCARILHQAPKYSPEEDNLDPDEENPNPIAMAQGRNLDTPIGNKKAKKMKLIDRLGEDSAAASAQTDALNSVALAAAGLAKSMDRKRVVDSMHKQVSAYIKLGMKDEAKQLLEEITKHEKTFVEEDKRQLDQKPAPKQKEAVPGTIEVGSGGSQSTQEGEEGAEQQMTFRTEIDNALDTGDEGDSSEEDTDHPSQPSNDSRLDKTRTRGGRKRAV